MDSSGRGCRVANLDRGGYLLTAEQGADWQVTNSGAGPSQSVTKAGVAGQAHHVCGIFPSSSAGNGDWLLQQGATTILQGYGKVPVTFDPPLVLPEGAGATLTLQNAGADTVKVSIWGYTR